MSSAVKCCLKSDTNTYANSFSLFYFTVMVSLELKIAQGFMNKVTCYDYIIVMLLILSEAFVRNIDLSKIIVNGSCSILFIDIGFAANCSSITAYHSHN